MGRALTGPGSGPLAAGDRGLAPQPTWAAAATRPNASLLPWARPQPCAWLCLPTWSVCRPACGSTASARRALLGGATTEGGNLFGWLRDILTLPTPDELEELLAKKPADGHGLTVLPFIAGERAPAGAKTHERSSTG